MDQEHGPRRRPTCSSPGASTQEALGPEGKPSQGLTTKGQQEPPEGPLRGEQCQSTSRRAQARTTTQEQTRAVERTKEPGEASGQTQAQVQT